MRPLLPCGLWMHGWTTGFAMMLLTATAVAQGDPAGGIDVQDCRVRFAAEINVPALETGRVDAVGVANNQMVRSGDLIAKLDDQTVLMRIRAAQVRLRSAQTIAADEKQIRFAEHALKEATDELDSLRSIQSEALGAVASSQVRRLRLAVERARLEKELAERDQVQARAEVEIREAELAVINDQLSNLHVESPIDGILLKVARAAGEWVQQGDTVATVARIDRLHVHGVLSSQAISPSACRGLPVSVQWRDLSTDAERSLRGKVLSVDPQMLPGGFFVIHAEIVNRPSDADAAQWLLMPGSEVQMKVYPSSATARSGRPVPNAVERSAMSHVSVHPAQSAPHQHGLAGRRSTNAAGDNRLRHDLNSVSTPGPLRRTRLVIDEIAGRFTRVSEHVWQSLVDGRGDETLWRQAAAAGWTRTRLTPSRRRQSVWCVRIPLISIDGVASALAPLSGWLFAPLAVAIWSLLVVVAAVLAISRGGELLHSVSSLQRLLQQSSPWWIAGWWVVTKTVHELAHAVMCRRIGARCGKIGVLVLLGMPCPYCDVTDVWRHPSPWRRAAVMFAGIYVEWIVAAIATLVWIVAADPIVRCGALNLMIVCGISTLVFNANPLMRYDGYYLLADLVGSVHLRREAAQAFRSSVIHWIAGPNYAEPLRKNSRVIALASYHVAATAYRVMVAAAIAALLVTLANHFQLRPLAVIGVAATAVVIAFRTLRRLGRVIVGDGRWQAVTMRRRFAVVIALGMFAALLIAVPMPRHATVTGWVDVADATGVFVPHEAMVQRVAAEFGQHVDGGDLVVQLHSDALVIERASMHGQWEVAKCSSLVRRRNLDTDAADQWRMTSAAEEAMRTRLVATDQRLRQSAITAPVSGWIVPAEARQRWDGGHAMATPTLANRVGAATNSGTPWCRIATSTALRAVLVIDARERHHAAAGASVRVQLNSDPQRALDSQIESVSSITPQSDDVLQTSQYRVECPLPAVPEGQILNWLGQPCRAVVRLPARSLGQDIWQSLQEWVRG